MLYQKRSFVSLLLKFNVIKSLQNTVGWHKKNLELNSSLSIPIPFDLLIPKKDELWTLMGSIALRNLLFHPKSAQNTKETAKILVKGFSGQNF